MNEIQIGVQSDPLCLIFEFDDGQRNTPKLNPENALMLAIELLKCPSVQALSVLQGPFLRWLFWILDKSLERALVRRQARRLEAFTRSEENT